MADTAPEPESAADENEAERAEDEMKRKFREALDRKRSQLAEHNQTQNGKGGGKVQGAHGPAQSSARSGARAVAEPRPAGPGQ